MPGVAELPTPIEPSFISPGPAVVCVPDECDGHGVQYDTMLPAKFALGTP